MIIRQRVGRRGTGNRHHSFGKPEADIGRVGADGQRVVVIHRRDLAVGIDTHFRRVEVITRLAVGDEGIHAVGGIFHRPAHHFRDRHHRDLFAMHVDLQAETAADIWRNNLHFVFRDTEMAGIDILHLVGRLVRLVNRQPFLYRVPVGQDRPAFQRDRRMATEFEFMFNRERRRRERRVDVTGPRRMLETEIIAQLRMDRRRTRLKRLHHIHDGG